jgi:hypothetical protein
MKRALLLLVGGWAAAALAAGGSPLQAAPKTLSREEQQKVDRAIERGVAYLKRMQNKDGSWSVIFDHTITDQGGHSFMPLLALLESDVPVKDPAVQKGVQWTRTRLPQLNSTYEISLALLVLDRLGDPQDKKMIESLALRLIAGQCHTGGWSYRCLKLSEDSEARLLALLRQPADKKGEVPQSLRLLAIFQKPDRLVWQDPPDMPGNKQFKPIVGMTDNSNTQFALLGLWAARRHDVPIERTLRLAVQRFETSQNSDGSWNYNFQLGRGVPRPRQRAMTAVGLLALALREGLKLPSTDPANVPRHLRIACGLAVLSRDVTPPTGQMKQRVPCQDLYFLWSVERVAMLYGLPLIGDRDWYRWGAEILVTNQRPSGAWPEWQLGPRDSHSNYLPTINTAFALLFLKRSNLLADLTVKLPFEPEKLNRSVVQARDNPLGIAQMIRAADPDSRQP